MSAETEEFNKHCKTYQFPFDVGDKLYMCTCMGFIYSVEEMDKCKDWEVTQIRIGKNHRITFDVEKGKNNSSACIPIEMYGITFFDNEADAIQAIYTMNLFKEYYLENDLDDLTYDELLCEYIKFKNNH